MGGAEFVQYFGAETAEAGVNTADQGQRKVCRFEEAEDVGGELVVERGFAFGEDPHGQCGGIRADEVGADGGVGHELGDDEVEAIGGGSGHESGDDHGCSPPVWTGTVSSVRTL